MSGIQMAVLGSGTPVINVSAQFIAAGAVGTATALYRLGSDGKVYQGINGTVSELEQWCVPSFFAGDYEARATVTIGSLTTGTTGTWLSLGTTRDWTLQETISGNTSNCTFTIELRRAGSTVVIDSATIDLEASRF